MGVVTQGEGQIDVRNAVIERFKPYLGEHDDLSLQSRLLDDFGIDSVVLVTIIMDLVEALELDLTTVSDLDHVGTLADVIALIDSMQRNKK
jgi:acyl carrier protein